MKSTTRNIILAAILVLFVSVAMVSADEDWPTREIRMIVGYGAGGSTDLSARFVAHSMSEYLGVPVVVENMPGVSSLISQEYLVGQEPDGYTVSGVGTIGLGANPHIHGVDPFIDDLAFCALYMSTQRVLYSHDFENWQEMEDYMRENPGTLSIGIAGSAFNEMVLEAFLEDRGLEANLVMFGGAAQLSAALIGGHIPAGEATVGSPAWDAMEAGDLHPLFVMSDHDLSHIGHPDIPTMLDVGAEVVSPGSQFGLIAPAGLPEDRRQKLEDAVKYALETEYTQERFENAGYDVTFMTGEEFEARVRTVNDIVKNAMGIE